MSTELTAAQRARALIKARVAKYRATARAKAHAAKRAKEIAATSAVQLCSSAEQAIMQGCDDGDCVAELELLGLPLHAISTIENTLGVIYLRDLLQLRPEKLLECTNFGPTCLKYLRQALGRYHELPRLRAERAAEPAARAQELRDEFYRFEQMCARRRLEQIRAE